MWRTIERPGYFGKKRDELVEKWNQEFGEGNWKIAYQWGEHIVPREFAIQLYEDGYYEFFRNDPLKLENLIKNYEDVYDTAPSNVDSFIDYSIQETPNNHIHDIAIRRAVLRHGEWFSGEGLCWVRWKGSDGFDYNPGVVLFHKPEMIVSGTVNDYGSKGVWWFDKTLEDFYQKNKVLMVRD